MSIIVTRASHCRDLGYNVAKALPYGHSAWDNTQVVLSNGDNASLLQNLYHTLGIMIRKTTGGDTATWLDPKRRIVVNPAQNPGPDAHTATGRAWLNVDNNGEPVFPQETSGVPTAFGNIDPLNPDTGNGVDTICIPYKRTMTLLHARNAIVKATEGGKKRFDFTDALVRHYTPTIQSTSDATPAVRPFVYPDGIYEKEYDHSYLHNVSRKMPIPSELGLPDDVFPDHSVASIGMSLEGTDLYDLGIFNWHDNPQLGYDYASHALCVIPEPPSGMDERFYKRVLCYPDYGHGSWVGEPHDGIMNAFFPTTTSHVLRATPRSVDSHCPGTVWDWTSDPAVELRRGWQLDGHADLTQEAGQAGLPERVFSGLFGNVYLPKDETAIDLLLVFVEYRFILVTVTRHVFHQEVALVNDEGVPTGYVKDFDTYYYTSSQTSPSPYNTFVWGQFRQIVPVSPKARASAQGA